MAVEVFRDEFEISCCTSDDEQFAYSIDEQCYDAYRHIYLNVVRHHIRPHKGCCNSYQAGRAVRNCHRVRVGTEIKQLLMPLEITAEDEELKQLSSRWVVI